MLNAYLKCTMFLNKIKFVYCLFLCKQITMCKVCVGISQVVICGPTQVYLIFKLRKLHLPLQTISVAKFWSADYGSFHQDLVCANDQNLGVGAGAQKFVRCAMKNLVCQNIFKCAALYFNAWL